MDELNLNLRIRKVEEGWDAEVLSDQGWSVGARGNTPQRAMLRLALALIARPKEMPRLQIAFAVEDAVVRAAIGDAENAVRKAERQESYGIGSVE